MEKNDDLRYGSPGETAVHICVDMQRMFAEDTEWKMPWLERVLPNVLSITSRHPERTIFTRFIPAQKPGQGVGMWRRRGDGRAPRPRFLRSLCERLERELSQEEIVIRALFPSDSLIGKPHMSPFWSSSCDE
jgi:nicotinamidase-related amidase